MQTGTKVLLGVLAAAGLYVVLSPKEASAAVPPGNGPPPPPPPDTTLPAPPMPPPGVLPNAKDVGPDEAAVYVAIQYVDASHPPWGPNQIGKIPALYAENDGYIVTFVNENLQPPPQPGEVIQAFTTKADMTFLHGVAFNAGLTPTLKTNMAFTLVTIPLGSVPPATLADVAGDPALKRRPTQWNGTGDGSVQRAEAAKAAAEDCGQTPSGNGVCDVVVYDAGGLVATDPKYGGQFIVAIGTHDS